MFNIMESNHFARSIADDDDDLPHWAESEGLEREPHGTMCVAFLRERRAWSRPTPRPLQLTWRIVIKEVMGTARLPLLKVMSESFLGSHSVRDWSSLASPWTKTGFESPGSGLSSTRPARALVFCVPRSALSPSTGSASSPIK